MDFRSPARYRRPQRARCSRCGFLLRPTPTRRTAALGALSLFAFAALALGLPLSFPEFIKGWLMLNVLLALGVGLVIAFLTTREQELRCPGCGDDSTNSPAAGIATERRASISNTD